MKSPQTDKWSMCTVPVLVKQPVCGWLGNSRTGAFASRWSRAVCGPGKVPDCPSSACHLKKWRHFQCFVSRLVFDIRLHRGLCAPPVHDPLNAPPIAPVPCRFAGDEGAMTRSTLVGRSLLSEADVQHTAKRPLRLHDRRRFAVGPSMYLCDCQPVQKSQRVEWL